MAIGERIHFFRLLRGMTQKYLGMALGFPEKSADVRLAQYETGSRTPKADLTAALAQVLDVSPHALSVPDIDSYVGLMHTLFTLEDNYGLKITEQDGELACRLICGKTRMLPGCMRCSGPGGNSRQLEAGEISRRITTAGVTTTRSTTAPRSAPRCRRRVWSDPLTCRPRERPFVAQNQEN